MNNEIELLTKLININSYSQTENKNIIDYISNICKNFKQTRIKNANDNRENLLIYINCEEQDCSPILLCGHIDTVKENNNLPARIEKDKIFGLGSCDMKCFFASILSNLNKLKSLNKPIIIAITSDEEIECESIKQIINYLKMKNTFPLLTILGEPTNNTISNSSKGCYEFKVDIKGKSCHSSKINEGINAINIAAKLITKIESLNNENISLNTGLITGGKQINIVPKNCSFSFDIRCFDKDILNTTYTEIEKEINSLSKCYNAKIKITKTLSLPCYKSKSDYAKNLAKTLSLKLTDFNAASEAGFYSEISNEVIIFGAGDLLLAHKQNEYVSITKLINYYEILEKIIKNLKF